MLIIAHKLSDLHFSKLMDIYSESIISSGEEHYPHLCEVEQRFRAETDFYHYLNSVFFRQQDSVYAIWEDRGEYKAALRLEPYSDGLLLCALETAPEARGKGFSTSLIEAVLSHYSRFNFGTIYSHISKTNTASIAVHQRCGFHFFKNYAIYADGSVFHDSFTMAFKFTKSNN